MDGENSRSRRKAAKTTRTEKAPARARSAKGSAKAPNLPAIDSAERHRMIELAAYYRAEQRGFLNGDPLQDWLEAEAEVTMRLLASETARPVK